MNNNDLTDRSTVRIYVIGHKLFDLPVQDRLYQPLLVGGKVEDNSIPEGWLSDTEGSSISEKNPLYNELTGLYWIWKNTDEDIVGICHYRRYFTTNVGKVKNLLLKRKDILISEENILKKLERADIILHNKTFFKKSNVSQAVATDREELINLNKIHPLAIKMVSNIINEKCPEYCPAFRKVMNSKSAHLLNMFISRRKVLNDYCEWLFPILFKIETELNAEQRIKHKDRMIGMIAERLLDVWVVKNRLKVKECFTINTERLDWKMW